MEMAVSPLIRSSISLGKQKGASMRVWKVVMLIVVGFGLLAGVATAIDKIVIKKD